MEPFKDPEAAPFPQTQTPRRLIPSRKHPKPETLNSNLKP